MREIYTSPRHENVDLVVALLAEHGIETKVNNRATYNRPSYNRFSYANPGDSSRWPQVEVRFAADLPKARELLRQAGLEPLTRHAEVLAAAREVRKNPEQSRRAVVGRVRMIAFAAIAVVLVLMVLRGMHLF